MSIAKQGSIVGGSFQMSWTVNAVANAASAAINGTISGDADGVLDHVTGRFSAFPSTLPPVGTPIRYRWSKAGDRTIANLSDLFLEVNGNTISGIIPEVPLVPGYAIFSLTLQIGDDSEAFGNASMTITDDGHGNLIHDVNNPSRTGIKILAGGLHVLVDNDGSLTSSVVGSINYSTGAFTINAPGSATFRVKTYTSYYPSKLSLQKEYKWTGVASELHPCVVMSPGLTKCAYLVSQTDNQFDITEALNALTFDFTPNSRETIAEGSLRFSFGGRTYIDRQGYLYSNLDPLTGIGEQSGTVDYSNGIVKLTSWTEGVVNAKVSIQSMLTSLDDHTVSSVTFRTPGAPVRPGSLYIQCLDSESVTHDVTVPASGVINSDIFDGKFDYETGICSIRFGYLVKASEHALAEWYDQDLVDANGNIFMPIQIKADSIRFNCVTYSYLPLDANVIGIDPVRLPTDGRVPILRKGGVTVVHCTDSKDFPNNVNANYVLDVGKTRLAKCWVEDATGKKCDTSMYSVDLDFGKITLSSPLNLTGYTQPLKAIFRIEDMAMLTDVEISGRLTFSKALSHDYPADKTYVSSALIIDDLWARISDVFDQTTWTGVWSDSLIGSQTNAQFNHADYPITATNRGALTERFALIFVNSTTFNIIGEHLGQIGSGTINETCAPINPSTKKPYFTINPLGWGSGWATGNVLRFNVHGADAPIWVARTILQSEAAVENDSFALQLRGNVNKD